MPKTIDGLFDAIKCDDMTLSRGVLNDYFGQANIQDHSKIKVIYGLYSGMIKIKGVSKEVFENCFFTNRLDALIHKMATYHKSGYYLQFCVQQITIGSTYMGDSGVAPLPIKNDDYCPSCETVGYITQNHNITFMAPDCVQCGTFMCKACVRVCDDVGICPACL